MATTTVPPTAPPAAGQRADARRNRRRILETARELFAEHGYDTQMEHIARHAGVGVGTVYRHFPNKEVLLQALIVARFEGLAQAARDGIADPDPWGGFVGFMRYGAGVMAADRALSEAMVDRPEMMRAGAEGAEMPALLDQLATRAQASGDLRPDVEWEDVPGLICGMGRAIANGKVGPLEMSWERYLAIILDGLRAPGSAPLPT